MRVIICAPVCLTLVFVMQDKGLVDQTRGILNWVTENCPDNFHQEIGYATVIPTELDAALQLAVNLLRYPAVSTTLLTIPAQSMC